MVKPFLIKTISARLLPVLLVFAPAYVGAAVSIVPHVATYDVRLGAVTGPEAPRQMSGTLVYLVRDRCDGFVQESTLDLLIDQNGDVPIRYQQSFRSFERHDQKESTFAVTITAAGSVVDSYTGTIERAGDDTIMTYSRPDSSGDRMGLETFTSQQDTLLSLAYTARVAEQAASGGRFVSHMVADGLLDDGPNRLSAVIGSQLAAAADFPDPDGLLTGGPWPVTIAYFPQSSTSELPSQEMRILLYAGGIVGEIDQDAGDYTVVTSLADLQTAPGCPD